MHRYSKLKQILLYIVDLRTIQKMLYPTLWLFNQNFELAKYI